MKKIISIIFLVVFTLSASAQEKAITETGEVIILYKDGTWKYQDKEDSVKTVIPVSKKIFKKDNKSSFLLKSKNVGLGFWLNPKKWSFKKATENPQAEYEIRLKKGDLYGMLITEKFEIPLENLKTIAYDNGKSFSPDLKIIKEEYRIVNGLKVLFMQMNGTIQGIKFSYYGYYYSNKSGTVQFITYTSQNLLDSYQKDCEEILNGIVEL